MSPGFKSSAKPKLACEIAADRVLAGRVSERGDIVEMCAAADLAPGSVVPDLLEANLRERARVFEILREALGNVGGRSRDVIAVLPDAAVRVMLLDFETLPANRQEAEGVVRFRLKKSLPFDVDKAKVSYHSQPAASGVRVVAAVALTSVIEEYESAFREAGYSPGVVLPSMLAALGAAGADRPTLGGQGGCRVPPALPSSKISSCCCSVPWKIRVGWRSPGSDWRKKSIPQLFSSRTPTI